jgi:hypothetical protein
MMAVTTSALVLAPREMVKLPAIGKLSTIVSRVRDNEVFLFVKSMRDGFSSLTGSHHGVKSDMSDNLGAP